MALVSLQQKSTKKLPTEPPVNPTIRRLKRLNQTRPYSYSDYHKEATSKLGLSNSFSNPLSNSDKVNHQRPISFHSCIPGQSEDGQKITSRKTYQSTQTDVFFNRSLNVSDNFDLFPHSPPALQPKIDENATSKTFECGTQVKYARPGLIQPTPIRLGNKGQVRTMAAIFNKSLLKPQRPTSPTSGTFCVRKSSNDMEQQRHQMTNKENNGNGGPEHHIVKCSKIPVKNTTTVRQFCDNARNLANSPKSSETSSNLSIGRTYETLPFLKYNPDVSLHAKNNVPVFYYFIICVLT